MTSMLNAAGLLAVLWLGLVSVSLNQAPGAPRDSGAPKAGQRLPAPRPPRLALPTFALKEALDTNHDGKLSTAEIQGAVESLKKLDKNHDGKLSAEEIGWPPRFPGFEPGGGPPGNGRGSPFGGFPFGDREQRARSFAERLMSRDANRDGKVAKQELPRSMHWLIPLAERNKDGAIDEEEARALAERLGIAASRPDSKPR